MRRWWWTPAIVFAAALALRIAIVVQLRGTALFRTPELDSIEYFTWAQRIASGNFTWPAAPPHGPGYPLFLGCLGAGILSTYLLVSRPVFESLGW